jgi:transcriptional regulator PpsR
VVDSATQRVVDANPAALGVLAQRPDKVVGRHLSQVFEPASAGALHVLSMGTTVPGREGTLVATKDGRRFSAGAIPFREDGNGLCLIRLGATTDESAADAAGEARVTDLLGRLPIAVLLVDEQFAVVWANPAFLDLSRLAHADQAVGQPIARWIGRTPAEADALEDLVRSRPAIERHATLLRGEFGTTEDIEIAAVRLEQGRFYAALLLRPSAAPRGTGLVPGGALPRSSEQMRDIVGRVPIKEIVRETTDIIERLSIEAALDLTGDNRAAAAELLGLSRQSLYSKMRRFGIGDLGGSDDGLGGDAAS